MFAVKKLGKFNTWEPVALYDRSFHYRGVADSFTSQAEAEDYLEYYSKKINRNRKIGIQVLKVFDEGDGPRARRTTKAWTQAAFTNYFA